MESNQAGSLKNGVEHRAQVAESGEGFGILSDQVKIQMGKKFHGAISAPLRKDDLNFFIQESGVNLPHFPAGGGHLG
jgi:hypothetical protein